MTSGDDADLIAMIGAIYDAVIEPDRWRDALDMVRRAFAFENSMLGIVALPRGQTVVQVMANVPAEFARGATEYNDAVLELWGGAARIAMVPLEEPVVQSRMTDPASWKGNAYFEEWGRPQGLVDAVAMALANDSSMVANVAFGKHGRARPVTDKDLEGLRTLAPHIRRAVTISRILDVSASAAITFEAALDAARSGVVLVDADMNVLHANEAAEAMLKSGDPIRSVGRKLALREELVPGQLQAAVLAASEDEAELRRRGIGIPARLRTGAPLAVHVMPLKRRSLRGGMTMAATAAVFVADAAKPIDMLGDAMRLLYELTPAEQRVFELLVAGRATHEIAQVLGVLPGTVRTQIQRVFEKTDRHTRADLARLSREFMQPA
jgi:DNA-binding NarL/FixJ family response regulator